MDGILEPAGDSWRLRFSRELAHPADVVWRALTEPEQLAAWFPQHVSGEWRVGARLHFGSQLVPDFDGEVLQVNEPRLLEFRWGTDVLRFEITPTAEGCMLTLTDTFTEQGKAARDAAGWHVCLDALEKALGGTDAPAPSHDGWAAAHERYVARFGPDAARIGPPSGN